MEGKYPKQVKIVELLEERGISHRIFADRIGMKQDSLSRKLGGSRRFTAQEMVAISAELREPIERLFVSGVS